jgi:hypothetical protein
MFMPHYKSGNLVTEDSKENFSRCPNSEYHAPIRISASAVGQSPTQARSIHMLPLPELRGNLLCAVVTISIN